VSVSVGQRSWCVVVPHHARGARLARHRLTTELSPLIPPDLLADTVAVAAELVGNAVSHAAALPGGVIRVAWRITSTDSRLLVEVRVTDGGASQLPEPRAVRSDAQDGRGLVIVTALAVRWGVERDGLGQCVWAELAGASPNGSRESSARHRSAGMPRPAALRRHRAAIATPPPAGDKQATPLLRTLP
jgi:anti-sigma regulatory factor (Ser/Thr protein kinase)